MKIYISLVEVYFRLFFNSLEVITCKVVSSYCARVNSFCEVCDIFIDSSAITSILVSERTIILVYTYTYELSQNCELQSRMIKSVEKVPDLSFDVLQVP